MSEPTKEAKQAAVWAGYPQTYAALYRAYCEGYDAATAKAQEELEWYKRDAQRAAACADEMAEKLRLAHQQPSAPLVAALEFIANDLSFTSLNTARIAARAALTGTEENVTKTKGTK